MKQGGHTFSTLPGPLLEHMITFCASGIVTGGLVLTCRCLGSSLRARAVWWAPVLFACPATLPHLPNTAPQVPLGNHSPPPLTPRGLGETHTIAQVNGVAQEWPGRPCHPHQAQGGDWLRDGNGAPARPRGPSSALSLELFGKMCSLPLEVGCKCGASSGCLDLREGSTCLR